MVITFHQIGPLHLPCFSNFSATAQNISAFIGVVKDARMVLRITSVHFIRLSIISIGTESSLLFQVIPTRSGLRWKTHFDRGSTQGTTTTTPATTSRSRTEAEVTLGAAQVTDSTLFISGNSS